MDVSAPATDPVALHAVDVSLPPVVRHPLLHIIQHLQHHVRAIALVQPLLPAHLRKHTRRDAGPAADKAIFDLGRIMLPAPVGERRLGCVQLLQQVVVAMRLGHTSDDWPCAPNARPATAQSWDEAV
eukprot:scaffold48999_cov58-Phaeocystis_antarctica.AAC.2